MDRPEMKVGEVPLGHDLDEPPVAQRQVFSGERSFDAAVGN
jgi:hypothetical protein